MLTIGYVRLGFAILLRLYTLAFTKAQSRNTAVKEPSQTSHAMDARCYFVVKSTTEKKLQRNA